MNEMTATKAWIAGRAIENILQYAFKSSKGTNEKLSSKLDPGVVSLLNRSIVLNCSASLRMQESGGYDSRTVAIGSPTDAMSTAGSQLESKN